MRFHRRGVLAVALGALDVLCITLLHRLCAGHSVATQVRRGRAVALPVRDRGRQDHRVAARGSFFTVPPNPSNAGLLSLSRCSLTSGLGDVSRRRRRRWRRAFLGAGAVAGDVLGDAGVVRGGPRAAGTLRARAETTLQMATQPLRRALRRASPALRVDVRFL